MPDMEIINQLAEDLGSDTVLKLMGVFKEDVDKRIIAIQGYLSADGGDLQEIRIHAHSLKGLCRTYGAAQSGDVAMALQDACDAGDTAMIRTKAQAALEVIPAEVDAVIEVVRGLTAN